MDFNTHDKLGCVKMATRECTELVLQHLCRLYVILYVFPCSSAFIYRILSQRSEKWCSSYMFYTRIILEVDFVHSGGNNMAGI